MPITHPKHHPPPVPLTLKLLLLLALQKTGKLATGANCVVTIADLSSKLRPIVPPLIIVSDAVEMSITRERDGYECESSAYMWMLMRGSSSEIIHCTVVQWSS